MRRQDPDLKLILCGSSTPVMPTYPEWDRLALETCWDEVDYLSLHYYADNKDDDTDSYLALTTQFEDQLDTLAATVRYVKAKQRSKKDVYLCWDEWNVSYKVPPEDGAWRVAPPIVEEVFNLEDALVVAQWLSVFLRRCDVLKIACVSMLLNVAGPLLTTRTQLLRQTTFYPLMLFSRYATGRALDPAVQAPTHVTKKYGEMPLLDVSASDDPATGHGAVFLVNRSMTEPLDTEVVWQDAPPTEVTSVIQLTGSAPKLTNSFTQPDLIAPRHLPGLPVEGARVKLTLPPLSFTVLTTRR